MIELIKQIKEKGYCKINSNFYKFTDKELYNLQDSYLKLPKDTFHGERYRAYTKYIYKNGDLMVDNNGFYAQSKQYNYDLGGFHENLNQLKVKYLKVNYLII